MSFRGTLKWATVAVGSLGILACATSAFYALYPSKSMWYTPRETVYSSNNEGSSNWPPDAISAETLKAYHGVPLSQYLFYEFSNENTGETRYVTITSDGYLETIDGELVTNELFTNSRVYAFME